MKSSVTNNELSKIQSAFSIKNFIADLPKMLNNIFTTIYKCITDFYDPDSNKIKCNKIEAGYIDATTIVAQNLTFKGSNGEMYNYNDIATIIGELERKVNNSLPITKEQLDALDASALIVINPNN